MAEPNPAEKHVHYHSVFPQGWAGTDCGCAAFCAILAICVAAVMIVQQLYPGGIK